MTKCLIHWWRWRLINSAIQVLTWWVRLPKLHHCHWDVDDDDFEEQSFNEEEDEEEENFINFEEEEEEEEEEY